jgi:NitT/TauT family transport system substrate-binding protein
MNRLREDEMKMTRREACELALAMLGAVALSRPARAAYSLQIMAPYYRSLITMSPIAIALENDLYAKHGVDVTGVLTSVGGGTGLRNMIGAGLPYAEMGSASVLAGFKAGLDFRIIHNSVSTVRDILWVTMPNSGITSIKDLVGKKVGISAPRSTSETLALMAFEKAGIAGQVKLVAIGQVGAGLSALENGGVDSTFILEPLWSAKQDRYRVAFTLDDLPPMSQDVGVATLDFMRDHGDVLRAIIAARREAVDFIYANPAEAARITSKRYGDTLPAEVAPIAIKRMIGINYWSRGAIDMESLETLVSGLKRQGEWDDKLELAKLVDRSFLPDDLKS